ncbi:protein FAM131C [Protopterus annectens]|uniref:protein FAM131C n=1 Tax=Protopterus annectens TaxID=7888 RepID=UPI001CFC3459|nr:protein FAM131C [Protopterus annectens]
MFKKRKRNGCAFLRCKNIVRDPGSFLSVGFHIMGSCVSKDNAKKKENYNLPKEKDDQLQQGSEELQETDKDPPAIQDPLQAECDSSEARENEHQCTTPNCECSKKCLKASNGILPDSKSSSNSYDITALATSSLIGLVQTIKDHITKPTAMARGRVAHLIEWKGWSTRQSGWDPSFVNEEHYSYLTDELKEARFAAGVAEQFAITEATLSAWSSLDDDEEAGDGNSSLDAIQLQDMECMYLQDRLFSGAQGMYSPNTESNSDIRFRTYSSSVTSPIVPQTFPQAEEWSQKSSVLGHYSNNEPKTINSYIRCWEEQNVIKNPTSGDQQRIVKQMTPVQQRQQGSNALHYVDSSSLSEDEVFYN